MGSLAQMFEELRAILGRHYPDFVYSGKHEIESREVPIFVFHEVQPETLEPALDYLKRNQYHTIDCDEYHAWITGAASLPDRSVLLAIDDGHETIWQYGLELLRKYDCRATVFLISGYMRERPSYFPNSADVSSGRYDAEAVADRGAGYYNLIYWEEAAEMQRSGHIDFQSHSLYHHMVFSGPELVGFFDADPGQRFCDWPLPMGYETHVIDDTIEQHLGFPVFRTNSIFSTSQRFLDDPEIRQRMEEKVIALGGRAFLAEKESAAALNAAYRELIHGHRAGSMQSNEELLRDVRSQLVRSRELIASRLEKPVRHFCFPYNMFREETLQLIKTAGYVSGFAGTNPYRRTNVSGDDPYRTVRLNNDYLATLPGSGRVGLLPILTNKLKHRVVGSKVN